MTSRTDARRRTEVGAVEKVEGGVAGVVQELLLIMEGREGVAVGKGKGM
jgi:hypothetical protein